MRVGRQIKQELVEMNEVMLDIWFECEGVGYPSAASLDGLVREVEGMVSAYGELEGKKPCLVELPEFVQKIYWAMKRLEV